MSVIYCSFCDQLSDTDYAPDFGYNEKTGEWKCEACKEEDGEIEYLALEAYLEKLRKTKPTGNHRYDEPDSDRGATDEGWET